VEFLQLIFGPLIDIFVSGAKPAQKGSPGGGKPGAPPAPGLGGGTPEDLQDALGHYAEADHDVVSQTELARRKADEDKFKAEQSPTHEEIQAFRVGEHYRKDGAPALPDAVPLGDLSSPEARIKALDKITQQSTVDASGEERCGPSSVVGAVLVAEGPKGLESLMDAITARGSQSAKTANADAFQKLREKIEGQKPLTVGDMHMLQNRLYDTMKVDMEHDDPTEGGTAGVKIDTIRDFVGGDEHLRETFEKNHMFVMGVDNTGGGSNNHAVLEIQDGKGNTVAIYDPSARQGGQMVTKKDEAQEYDDAHYREA
jgi:hypothetical protein